MQNDDNGQEHLTRGFNTETAEQLNRSALHAGEVLVFHLLHVGMGNTAQKGVLFIFVCSVLKAGSFKHPSQRG